MIFPKPRREAVVLLTPELLIEMSKDGPARLVRTVKHALPADAQLVRCAVSDYNGRGDALVRAIVSSESFAEVQPGEMLPELPSPAFELVWALELATEARERACAIETEWGASPGDADQADIDLLRRLADALTPVTVPVGMRRR